MQFSNVWLRLNLKPTQGAATLRDSSLFNCITRSKGCRIQWHQVALNIYYFLRCSNTMPTVVNICYFKNSTLKEHSVINFVLTSQNHTRRVSISTHLINCVGQNSCYYMDLFTLDHIPLIKPLFFSTRQRALADHSKVNSKDYQQEDLSGDLHQI